MLNMKFNVIVMVRRDEVSNLLYDIFKLAEGCKFYLRSTHDIPCMNSLVRILFTLGEYFCAAITNNAEFKND